MGLVLYHVIHEVLIEHASLIKSSLEEITAFVLMENIQKEDNLCLKRGEAV